MSTQPVQTEPVHVLRLSTRRGRTAALLGVSLVATGLLAWAMTQPAAGIGREDVYIGIFPVLALVCAYRVVRPKVPLCADTAGISLTTGLPVLGLKARILWPDVRRIRITARDLLLVELRDPEGWAADKPWLVRANVAATRRKFDAAAVIALRELAVDVRALPAELRALAPVTVEAV